MPVDCKLKGSPSHLRLRPETNLDLGLRLRLRLVSRLRAPTVYSTDPAKRESESQSERASPGPILSRFRVAKRGAAGH